MSIPVLIRRSLACLSFLGIAVNAFGQAPAPVRPPLMFREEWKQPPYTGQLNDENRRVTQAAVTNPNLELKLYGSGATDIGVYVHEGRHDLWNGMSPTPVAIMLRDRGNYFDLTGLARLRAIVRTGYLHVLHPAIKLADGTLLAGSQAINTNEEFLTAEVAYNNQRWFKLDPAKVSVGAEVKNPDLSKIDEVGFVDLAPGGGHGFAGWVNVSTAELYAKGVERGGGK
jgi:hypothetical protein